MGVHYLTTLLREEGLLPSYSHNRSIPHDDISDDESDFYNADDEVPQERRRQPKRVRIEPGSTLAVDGHGLAFQLHHMAYRRYYRDVVDRWNKTSRQHGQEEKKVDEHDNTNNHRGGGGIAGGTEKKIMGLYSQLLPSLLPTSYVEEAMQEFLHRSLEVHRVNLDVYLDGTVRRMKSGTGYLRTLDREESWGKLRQFCSLGLLPSFDDEGKNKRQKNGRKKDGKAGAGHKEEDLPEPGKFLSTFPLSPLFLDAILHQIRTRVHEQSSGRLHSGNIDQKGGAAGCWAGTASIPETGWIRVVQCDEEADVQVAKASYVDATGRTYAVGQDSDYVIYGDPLTTLSVDDGTAEGIGERSDPALSRNVKYIPLDTLSILSEDDVCGDGRASFSSGTSKDLTGVVLTREDAANAFGLTCERAMVELSILLGNDYTKPYLSDKSLRMTLKLPNREDLPRRADDTITLLRELGPGYSVQSTNPDFQRAIEFSRDLYGFRDVSHYPLDDNGAMQLLSAASPGGCDSDGGGDGNHIKNSSREDGEIGARQRSRPRVPGKCSPSFPLGFERSLAEIQSTDESLSEAALRPFIIYMSSGEADGSTVWTQPRIDALEASCDLARNPTIDDRRIVEKLEWEDIVVATLLEKCISTAIDSLEDMDSPLARKLDSICRVFDQRAFHVATAASRYNDSLVNEAMGSKHEMDFLDEALEVPSMLHQQESHQDNEGSGPDKGQLERETLPIDEHRESILQQIEEQRVTIIHGETGCGKSSRVPVFLLRAPPPAGVRPGTVVKMFISQPRRIAAKSLVERVRSCEPDLRDDIALRMGHGVREYETRNTRAWFVTTGYLVRLLANHPESFDDHTHLIIDEVHERSVDTDILCLLARRLLATHPTIRLVLMSATMAATLYQQYFGVPQPPIHVGARRFPIRELFLEDLPNHLPLPPKEVAKVWEVHRNCEKLRCLSAPPSSVMEKMYQLAVQVTLSVGQDGTSVLIFVPGMADIVSITELIEKVRVPGVVHTCFPIHGDIPFEEQLSAFDMPKLGEVKIVIATNAAESSVTLPAVDHVICLGLCKQIMYNKASHRQMLVPTWISKASATQRAGRTGRVRNGNVYRLYSRSTYEEYMVPFEEGEMLRTPLDSVILSLRDMLNEEVTPILLDCLEPPDLSNIERSFDSLHKSCFISEPNDSGEITSLGSLAVALGVDLMLGALVGLGVQFGVAAEAIEVAAILSFPKSPWLITNPLFHDADYFNETMSQTFMSKSHFDAQLYSEPLAIMNLLWDYQHAKNTNNFCRHFSISPTRIRRLVATRNSLLGRVAEKLHVERSALEVSKPPVRMEHAKVTILRLLQCWLFSDSMIRSQPSKTSAVGPDGLYKICVEGAEIEEEHLSQVLDSSRHPFSLMTTRKIQHTGNFAPIDESFLMEEFTVQFEDRLASYGLELGFGAFLWSDGARTVLFLVDGTVPLDEVGDFELYMPYKELVSFDTSKRGSKRGRQERACGLWVKTRDADDHLSSGDDCRKVVKLTSTSNGKHIRRLFKKHPILQNFKTLSCFFRPQLDDGRIPFELNTVGRKSPISSVDTKDLFASPNVHVTPRESGGRSQSIQFNAVNPGPLNSPKGTRPSDTANLVTADGGGSWERPVVRDVPEGARILSVLASNRRKGHSIFFQPVQSQGGVESPSRIEEEVAEVALDPKATKVDFRWKHLITGKTVYVQADCVPAAASSTDRHDLIGCCANSLEVRGGGMRVEGLTLLPQPAHLFYELALKSFGLDSSLTADRDYELDELDVEHRLDLAERFHESCHNLGDQLVCHPDKVRELCEIFDGFGGAVAPWHGLDSQLAMKKRVSDRVGRNYQQNGSRSLTTQGHREQSDDDVVDGAHASVARGGNGHSEALRAQETGTPPAKNNKPEVNHSTSGKKSGGLKKRFFCPACGQNDFKKWTQCNTHLKRCCPDLKLSILECRDPSAAPAEPHQDGQCPQNGASPSIIRDLREEQSDHHIVDLSAKLNDAWPSVPVPDSIPPHERSSESCVDASVPRGANENSQVTPSKYNEGGGNVPSKGGKPKSKGGKVQASKKGFLCPTCGKKFKQWCQCREHLLMCCPELAVFRSDCQITNTTLKSGKSADGTCNNSTRSPKTPNVSIADDGCAKGSSTRKSGGNKAVDVGLLVYTCPNCYKGPLSWEDCKAHMGRCCPGLSFVRQDCEISDTEGQPAPKTTQPRSTGDDNARRNTKQGKDNKSKDKKPQYGCPSCGKRLPKYGRVLTHMEECCPGLLRKKKGLRKLCCIVPVPDRKEGAGLITPSQVL